MKNNTFKVGGMDFNRDEFFATQTRQEKRFGESMFNLFLNKKDYKDNFDSKGNLLESSFSKLFTDKEVVNYYTNLALNPNVSAESKLRGETFLYISNNIKNFQMKMWKPNEMIVVDEEVFMKMVSDDKLEYNKLLSYINYGKGKNIQKLIVDFFSSKKITQDCESYVTLQEALKSFEVKGSTMTDVSEILSSLIEENESEILESDDENVTSSEEDIIDQSNENADDNLQEDPSVETEAKNSKKPETKTALTKDVEKYIKEVKAVIAQHASSKVEAVSLKMIDSMVNVTQSEGVTSLNFSLKDNESGHLVVEFSLKSDILKGLMKYKDLSLAVLPNFVERIEESLSSSNFLNMFPGGKMDIESIMGMAVKEATSNK